MTTIPDQNEVSSHIIEIIENHLGEKAVGNIAADTSLEAIEIESIDMVEIIFNIEDKYDVNVPLDQISGAATVGDISDRLMKILENSQQA